MSSESVSLRGSLSRFARFLAGRDPELSEDSFNSAAGEAYEAAKKKLDEDKTKNRMIELEEETANNEKLDIPSTINYNMNTAASNVENVDVQTDTESNTNDSDVQDIVDECLEYDNADDVGVDNVKVVKNGKLNYYCYIPKRMLQVSGGIGNIES